MTILLKLPKDLGEGILCASATKKLKEYAVNKQEELTLVGSKLMHGWIETFSGEEFNHADIEDIDFAEVSSVVDFNIHEPFEKHDDIDISYYGLDNIDHIETPNAGFDDGAIVTPTHIVQMMENVLKELGTLNEGEALEPTAIPERLKRTEMVEPVLDRLGLDNNKPIALIIPSCAPNRPKKRWSPENYAKVAELMEESGMQPVLIGGPNDEERELCANISNLSKANIVDACGETQISELCSLASASDLVLGGDTGPIHLAAASGAKTFAMFGRGSDPNSWRPLSVDEAAHSIWVENLAELTPEDVWETIEAVTDVDKKNNTLDLER